MPTNQQDRSFAEHVKENSIDEAKVSTSALDNAIEWIDKNLQPEDVFDEDKLHEWAINNGYKTE